MSKYDMNVSFWDKRKPIDVNSNVVSLREYAQRNHLTYNGAYRRLCSKKIKGYKRYGRWWIYVQSS